ncbi:flagellar biosynthesis protein FlhF [Paenibacillus lignilyticus]|uniref:Flagellar biosynthesis protein FlhF n=1 Tax=Paenibacillus lignilyticus TaxID=1172615 RepID=A0ABS5CHC2_9BACL|nr:flagellar biosynthesis protein FlhF [Paenibacillus lignilyticus]MBP3965240.1 flagellar biosynthesis protein FlhF [Paenibacillus lignilyticus]
MKVKRYVVNALPEALPMIRNELGVDAIILNTKEIRVGGFLGMFGKKKTEVIAAIEAGSKSAPTPKSPPRPQPAKQPAVSPSMMASIASMASTAVAEQQVTKEKPTRQDAAVHLVPEVPEAARVSPAATYEARMAVQQQQSGEENRKPRLTEEELIAEIRDMKQWIVRMSKQQKLETRPEALQVLQERLLEQEVSQKLIDKLIDEIEEKLEVADLSTQPTAVDRLTVWRIAEQLLLEWLKDFEASVIGRDTQVIHFVGPTGVGKTTSIAKLAAEQTLKSGRKVGFITSDTYRIAAVDQLRTYATILNVPLEVVFSPSEVARAFKQLEDRELIFMDTAGRNFRNELYVSEVNSLLQSDRRSETFLVLSLTSKFADMSSVAENFAKYGIDRVLYTKQDETNACGAILNLAMEQGLRPTYIAYGQTVPDDITTFKVSTYVSQLLGESQ